MNKNLEFIINEEKTIFELNKELEDYDILKSKFLQKSMLYDKTQKDTFLNNYYNSKLNTILSVIKYYSDKNELTSYNNPFSKLNNRTEKDELSTRICKLLSNLDVDLIIEKGMHAKYHNLAQIVKKEKSIFIKNIDFWNDFIELHNGMISYV